MSAIKGRNTAPELSVRAILRELGIGYRLHAGGLPGKPDIVMKGRKKIILVHGCFWHRHANCRYAYQPKSRQEFWTSKFARNIERDKDTLAKLGADQWDVLVIWECEAADAKLTRHRIRAFLELKLDEHGREKSSGEKASAPRRRRSTKSA